MICDESIAGMGETIYNMLPDVSGVLLAAVGVALVVAPDMMSKVNPVLRSVMAASLVLLGVAGLRSSFVQHRQDGIEKSGLRDDVKNLRATVDTYGPKLDFIINHPESPEQKALALALQREMNPKIEIDEPHNTPADPNMFQWTLINTGGSVAKAKANQVIALVAPEGRGQEEAIFANFYKHDDDLGQRKLDMPTGYEHRTVVNVHVQPPSSEEQAAFKSGTDVIYLAILVTYYNEQGRQFHSEKCVIIRNGNPQMAGYCGSHNKIQ
jgi:hypothetical protein